MVVRVNESSFKVVLNDEEYYSIWPADQATPNGWRDEGTVGSKENCLAHIEKVWVDMRPKSLRATLARNDSAI
jgi:MbtH protein